MGELEGVTLNYEAPGIKKTFWMVTAILERKYGLEKGHLMELMGHKAIDCRPFFHPLSSLPAFQDLEQAHEAKRRNKVSYEISPYGINLPSGMMMTDERVSYVCKVLKVILGLR